MILRYPGHISNIFLALLCTVQGDISEEHASPLPQQTISFVRSNWKLAIILLMGSSTRFIATK